MVRILGFLVGLGFVGVASWSLFWGVIAVSHDGLPHTVEHRFHLEPRDVAYSFDGPLGRFDKQQLQRGFQVYKEVCSACHSLRLVAFRDLKQIGYNDDEGKAIAAGFQVPGLDPNTGEVNTRPGPAPDYFPKPFANDIAARAANNNAVPPDLS